MNPSRLFWTARTFTVCSWCNRITRRAWLWPLIRPTKKNTTHGICEICFGITKREILKLNPKIIATVFGLVIAGALPAAPHNSGRAGQTFTDAEAVRAIYGEACGEPYAGKLAVAGAIRNRGTLKGVYGKTSKLLSKPINQKAWAACNRAWSESVTNDITRGATHWENVKAFGTPYWAKSMQACGTFGNQIFFK